MGVLEANPISPSMTCCLLGERQHAEPFLQTAMLRAKVKDQEVHPSLPKQVSGSDPGPPIKALQSRLQQQAGVSQQPELGLGPGILVRDVGLLTKRPKTHLRIQ